MSNVILENDTYCTGTKNSAANELILFIDNTKELAAKRDDAYKFRLRVGKFKNILSALISYIAIPQYNSEINNHQPKADKAVFDSAAIQEVLDYYIGMYPVWVEEQLRFMPKPVTLLDKAIIEKYEKELVKLKSAV
jgi:hypothetical protein